MIVRMGHDYCGRPTLINIHTKEKRVSRKRESA
jgi:hypothetical protein